MILHIEFHSTVCKDSDTLTTTKVFSGVVKEELLECFSRSRKLKKKKNKKKTGKRKSMYQGTKELLKRVIKRNPRITDVQQL